MDPAQSADPRRVLADRVEQLYSQLPLAIAATFLVGLLAAYELRFSRMPGYEWLFWSWGAGGSKKARFLEGNRAFFIWPGGDLLSRATAH